MVEIHLSPLSLKTKREGWEKRASHPCTTSHLKDIWSVLADAYPITSAITPQGQVALRTDEEWNSSESQKSCPRACGGPEIRFLRTLGANDWPLSLCRGGCFCLKHGRSGLCGQPVGP